jgi:hypothetical protein
VKNQREKLFQTLIHTTKRTNADNPKEKENIKNKKMKIFYGTRIK